MSVISFSDHSKMSKLLDTLPQCGSQAFDILCEILSDINPAVVKALESPLPLTTPMPMMSLLDGLANMMSDLCIIS